MFGQARRHSYLAHPARLGQVGLGENAVLVGKDPLRLVALRQVHAGVHGPQDAVHGSHVLGHRRVEEWIEGPALHVELRPFLQREDLLWRLHERARSLLLQPRGEQVLNGGVNLLLRHVLPLFVAHHVGQVLLSQLEHVPLFVHEGVVVLLLLHVMLSSNQMKFNKYFSF